MRLAYNRGAAFFLPDRFPGADILIQIKVSALNMAFCAIQVKNRHWNNQDLRFELNDETSSEELKRHHA
jgi:hypothetical protein